MRRSFGVITSSMNGVKIILRLAFFLWLMLITILSVIPSSDKFEMVSDKLIHFVAYFITTSLLYFAFKPERVSFLFLYGFLVFLYSTVIEIVQFFLPYRNFSIGDIIVNISGIMSFTLFCLVYTSFRIKRGWNS
jgi:hypothetical protein